MAALLLVAGIAAAVVAVAVRAGIASRRQAIAILHELGATDSDIAGRFARRVALLAGAGGLAGTAAAVDWKRKRLNPWQPNISYAVFFLEKKNGRTAL